MFEMRAPFAAAAAALRTVDALCRCFRPVTSYLFISSRLSPQSTRLSFHLGLYMQEMYELDRLLSCPVLSIPPVTMSGFNAMSKKFGMNLRLITLRGHLPPSM